MTITKISKAHFDLITAERAKNRTDRQIEAMLGLPYGILQKPFLVDDTEERAAQDAKRQQREYDERMQRRWEALGRPVPIRGWRPNGNCVQSRPNAVHRPVTIGEAMRRVVEDLGQRSGH